MSNISALVSIELWSIVCHENLVIIQVGEGQITTVKRLRSVRWPFVRANDEGLVLKKKMSTRFRLPTTEEVSF